ncbi:MAG: MBL fold metallo-hydrolase [Pseudonocardiaceae bacterium]
MPNWSSIRRPGPTVPTAHGAEHEPPRTRRHQHLRREDRRGERRRLRVRPARWKLVLNNTGFLVGRQGVISIDTSSTERRTRAYLDAIAAVTSQPVRTLVNTHHHDDHTFGNCLLPEAIPDQAGVTTAVTR